MQPRLSGARTARLSGDEPTASTVTAVEEKPMTTTNQLQLSFNILEPLPRDRHALLRALHQSRQRPGPTLPPARPELPTAVHEFDLASPRELLAVEGESVVDVDTHALLAGPPSFELVDACRRAPFLASAACRDVQGIWQYISPRERLLLRRAPQADVRVVYLDQVEPTPTTTQLDESCP
jgi:hypothetical protein